MLVAKQISHNFKLTEENQTHGLLTQTIDNLPIYTLFN